LDTESRSIAGGYPQQGVCTRPEALRAPGRRQTDGRH
jgi:hypothetical protein